MNDLLPFLEKAPRSILDFPPDIMESLHTCISMQIITGNVPGVNTGPGNVEPCRDVQRWLTSEESNVNAEFCAMNQHILGSRHL